MATEETTTLLTHEDLLEVLWPDADSHAYLEAAGMNGREWFRHYRSGWKQMGPFKFGTEPGFERLFTLAGGADLSFAAALRSQPAAGAALLPLRFLWAGITLRVEGKRLHDAGLRLVAGEAEAARARLLSTAIPASLVLGEGTRTTGIWLLSEPLDLGRGRLWLQRLAAQVGGGRELADPDRAMLRLPGSVNAEVFPRFTVHAEASSPLSRAPLAEIERWLA